MKRLIDFSNTKDIPLVYRNTPIGRLLEYHNLNKPFEKHNHPEMIIGTCIDYRINLRIPDNFSYLIRAGGGNLKYNEFKIPFPSKASRATYVLDYQHGLRPAETYV